MTRLAANTEVEGSSGMQAPTGQLSGSEVIACALKAQGVECVFGVVGVPVVEVAEECMRQGIQFIGCRNEQTAAYAANAYGFLNGRPGVCLTVSGPGMVHALSGLSNALANAWPMLLLSGSADTNQESMGAFQEWPQVESARLYTKYAARPDSLQRLPYFVERAFRIATHGRPGPCYLDIPGNMITTKISAETVPSVPRVPPPPPFLPPPDQMRRAIQLLSAAQSPLVVVGKGAAYACATGATTAADIRKFIERLNVPFLPTPMGKGVVPDQHGQCVAAARSTALRQADVVLLLGARLNWMLHFGQEPRFHRHVTFIQVDVCAEEMGNYEAPGKSADNLALVGDICSVVGALAKLVSEENCRPFDSNSSWWTRLRSKMESNRTVSADLVRCDRVPMNYYRPLFEIKQMLPDRFVLVNEGANTMDICRTIVDQSLPLSRLDCGTFSVMGLGMGYAIAAQLTYPDRRVIAIQGDSAFGFSGMDLETVARMNLPIVFVVVNNSGIYSGIGAEEWRASCERSTVPVLPSTSLLPDTRYEKIAEAFGIAGYYVKTPGELRAAFGHALSKNRPAFLNVIIETQSKRKEQEFAWLTRDEESKL